MEIDNPWGKAVDYYLGDNLTKAHQYANGLAERLDIGDNIAQFGRLQHWNVVRQSKLLDCWLTQLLAAPPSAIWLSDNQPAGEAVFQQLREADGAEVFSSKEYDWS